MFTNATCTLFRKGIDTEKRLPVWEAVEVSPVYWEESIGQTVVSNQGGAHEQKQKNSVFVVIPKASLPDPLPKKDDLIAYGTTDDRAKAHTISSVENFLYGSEAVQHLEVTAI